jgi:hypothetical protein
MTNDIECPFLANKTRILELSSNLTTSFQQLAQVMEACRDCPQPECFIRANINSQVTAAIAEITEEWNLAETLNHG